MCKVYISAKLDSWLYESARLIVTQVEGYVFGYIYLSVCVCDCSKSNEWMFLNIFMQIGSDQREKWFHFGKDIEHIVDTKYSKIFKGPIYNILSMSSAFSFKLLRNEQILMNF